MSLTIALLGPPVVLVDGTPLTVDTRKAVALLAYLALSGRPHRREELVELLWPGAGPDRGRATLRRTLSTLRSALGDRWLRSDQGTLALDLVGVDLDVGRFRAAIAASADADDSVPGLERAVAVYRDDLLSGFGLRDSPAFDDWQQATAGALRRELEQVLDRLVLALGAAGRSTDAIAVVQRRLALDPLFEPAHRALIGLLAASGRRAEALVQYRDCVRLLDRELGVRPLPETTAFYEAVSAGLPVPWPPPASPPSATVPPPTSRGLPLVGRESTRGALLAAHAAAATNGAFAVVEGEGGIGKTRLLEEIGAAVAATGSTVVRARSFEGEGALPFGLVASLLRAALDEAPARRLEAVPVRFRAEAARIVPELAPAGGPAAGAGPAAEQRLHEGVAEVLGGLAAGERPGLIVADDLHHADAASIAVLAFLAHRIERHRALCLVAWRGEEAAPGVLALRRAAAPAVRLRRLDEAAVAVLVGAAGLDEPAGRVLDETGGLPLFVVEYLRAVAAGGDPASGGISQLLAARVDQVGATAQQLLAAAAVIGTSFDVDVLRLASGRGDDETVDGLEELVRHGLLGEADDGYAFAHERLRGVVVERTGLARTRLLHRRVAEALTLRRGDPAVVARHLLAGGLEEQAAEAFRAAGDRARALGATAEALEAYRNALALAHPDVASLETAIGDLLTLRGDYPGAIGAYEAAAATSPGLGAVLEHRLGRVHERRGDAALAARHLDEALRLGGPTARLQADRSLAARRAGHHAEAVALAEAARVLAEAEGDDEAVAQALNLTGMLAGDVAALERSAALAEGFADRSVLVAALNNLALAAARDGEDERAVALTVRALALCAEQGDRHREAALHNNLADLHHRAGRPEESMVHLKRAVVLFAEIGSPGGALEPEVWKLVDW